MSCSYNSIHCPWCGHTQGFHKSKWLAAHCGVATVAASGDFFAGLDWDAPEISDVTLPGKHTCTLCSKIYILIHEHYDLCGNDWARVYTKKR